MRIGYHTCVFLDEPGAAANHVRGVVRAWVEQGRAVTLLRPARHPFDPSVWPLAPAGFRERRVWRPAWRGGWRLFERLAAARLALGGGTDADILYCRFTPSLPMAWAIRRAGRFAVAEINGQEILHASRTGSYLRAFDLLLVDSLRVGEALAARWGLPSERFRLHSNVGVDLDLFRPLDRLAARIALGLAPEDEIFLHVSGFQPYHDFPTLFAAFRTLRARRKRCRLLLVGQGDGRAAALAGVEDLRREGAVLAPGAVPLERVPTWMAAADVCLDLLTADKLRERNFNSLKLYEYLACRKPVVVSASPEHAAEAWTEESLFVVPPQTPEAVVQAAEAILERPAQALDRAETGRRHVAARFSWPAVAAHSLAQIEAAMAARSRPGAPAP